MLSNYKYKDCFEAIKLLAKVKSLQDKKYEALALYKRIIELNPKDYKSCYDVALLFDHFDQTLALSYYEQGLRIHEHELETRLKLQSDHMTEE